MNKLILSLITASTCVVLSSCGYDLLPDKRQLGPSGGQAYQGGGQSQLVKARECRSSMTKGCLSGQVVVSPFIYLDSQKYFDAEDLGQVFSDLVVIRDDNGSVISKSNYVIDISPKITNETFLEEFAVYVKGDNAGSADLSSKGEFMLRGLDAGQYDIRVQKSFTMTLKPKEVPSSTTSASHPPVGSEGTKAAISATKVYCFTIYASESQLTVEPGATQHKVFDHFKLHMIDRVCKDDDVKGPVITLK